MSHHPCPDRLASHERYPAVGLVRRGRHGRSQPFQALGCSERRAVGVDRGFRDDCDVERLGAGFGLSRATAYRHRDEAVRVLPDRAPDLQQTLEQPSCPLTSNTA